MLWRGFRADRIILCLLLKYAALEAQIMIRVIKPWAAACGMVLEAWERSLAAPSQRDRAFWGLTSLWRGERCPPLISSGATIPPSSGEIKHETPVWVSKHSPLPAGSWALSDLWGTGLPWLVLVVWLKGWCCRDHPEHHSWVWEGQGLPTALWRNSAPAQQVFNPLPETKTLNIFLCHEIFLAALGEPMLNHETLSLALAEHWEFHCLYFIHVLRYLLPRDAFPEILQENRTHCRLLSESCSVLRAISYITSVSM